MLPYLLTSRTRFARFCPNIASTAMARTRALVRLSSGLIYLKVPCEISADTRRLFPVNQRIANWSSGFIAKIKKNSCLPRKPANGYPKNKRKSSKNGLNRGLSMRNIGLFFQLIHPWFQLSPPKLNPSIRSIVSWQRDWNQSLIPLLNQLKKRRFFVVSILIYLACPPPRKKPINF